MKKLLVIKLNEVRTAIQRSQNFRASNLFAVVEGNVYRFYSHATLIAEAEKCCDWYKLSYFDNRYYSTTTSKYQNLILSAFCYADEIVTNRKIYNRTDFE